MRIRIERSGGFAGIPITNEMDSKDLPSALVRAAKNIIEDKSVTSSLTKSSPKGAADHYTYKISIQDGLNRRVIECNQYNIESEIKSLVNYIERNSLKKNESQ